MERILWERRMDLLSEKLETLDEDLKSLNFVEKCKKRFGLKKEMIFLVVEGVKLIIKES